MKDDRDFDRAVKDRVTMLLPEGFAESVTAAAFAGGRRSLLDSLLGLGPRAGIAAAMVSVTLLVLGFLGSGPDLVDLFFVDQPTLQILPL